MPLEWEVQRPSAACTVCGKAFEAKERFYAALFDRGAEFERRDFCRACWEKAPPAAFSFWLAKLAEPEQERKLLVDDDVIVNFFQRLEGETEPMKVNFRYIVALVLMRKRILKFESTEREGDAEFWLLRMRRDRTVHRVANPRLKDDEIQRLSEEVGALLNVET